MSAGVFTDKKHQPADTEVRAAVGARWLLWEELVRWVREGYPAQEDFKFLYGKNYGWALRFRIKGQLLVSLYPASDSFTAQVNLSPAAIEAAQRMELGDTPKDDGCSSLLSRGTTCGMCSACWLCALSKSTYTARLSMRWLADGGRA